MCFFWQPSYYSIVFGEDLERAALLSIVPWAASAVTTNLAGWAADALANQQIMSLTSVRKVMQGTASFGPACCLFLLAFGMHVSIPSTHLISHLLHILRCYL